jgi:hypothetical protein
MKPYVVRQGDYLTKLAHTMGFDPDLVWNHSKNSELRERRADKDLLHPGDILWLPPSPDKKRLQVRSGAANRYIARIPKKPVEVRIQVGGEPLADEPAVILGIGPDPLETKTDEAGWIRTEVQVHVREIEVILPRKRRTLRVRVGEMDPVNTVNGLRKRLQHLGFYQPTRVGVENQDASDPSALIGALKAFQMARNIAPSGKLDDETKSALLAKHGS